MACAEPYICGILQTRLFSLNYKIPSGQSLNYNLQRFIYKSKMAAVISALRFEGSEAVNTLILLHSNSSHSYICSLGCL